MYYVSCQIISNDFAGISEDYLVLVSCSYREHLEYGSHYQAHLYGIPHL